MLAIINFEFLISPALNSPIFYEELVDEIRMLSELIKEGNNRVLIEEDSVLKMIENNFFPSKNIYHSIVAQLSYVPPYGAEDVVRMVNSILEKAEVFDSEKITHAIEWESSSSITPNIHYLNDNRAAELQELYENLIIENEFSGVKYSSLYYHPDNPIGKQSLGLTGKIKDIIPACSTVLPCDFLGGISLFYCLGEYLKVLDGHSLYLSAKTNLDLKFSLYVGAVRLISDNNIKTSLDWDSFKIGGEFVSSLILNEAYKDQQYGSSSYESIVYLLAGVPKNNPDYFYRSDDPKKPRVIGNYVAHRLHITKSVRALRLLYWIETGTGKIILANVGNKSELTIESP